MGMHGRVPPHGEASASAVDWGGASVASVARWLGVLALVLPLVTSARSSDVEPLALARGVSGGFSLVATEAARGIVQVTAYSTRGGVPKLLRNGSGVVIDADGGVLTNAFLVGDADVLRVTFVGEASIAAELRGLDPESDLALLRVARACLEPLEFRAEPPRIGESVLALGNALGDRITVSAGIVSGLGRSIGSATYEDLLQTDAVIHAGNTGGALLDLDGRVIGVNTAAPRTARGGAGLGFAISAQLALEVAAQLARDGAVTRGFLGVQLALVDADGRQPRVGPGAFVGIESVNPGSPAERAGLTAGDVLVRVNGVEVQSVAGMLALVARLAPRSQVELEVKRRGDPLTVTAVLDERPPGGSE